MIPRQILICVVILCLITSEVGAATYTNVYPYAFSPLGVNATSYYSSATYPWFPFNPALSNTSSYANNQWYSGEGQTSNQVININLSVPAIVRRIEYQNSHQNAAGSNDDQVYTRGIANTTVWGSNSTSDWFDITTANGTWDKLSIPVTDFDVHGQNAGYDDPKNFTISNTIAYKFYRIRITTNYGGDTFIGVRRIFLQTEDGFSTSVISSFSATNISTATNITSTSIEGVTPFTMRFDNTSTGPEQNSWIWNATDVTGDNVPITINQSSFYSIIHTFNTAGNYSIKLNASSTGSTNISTQVYFVNLTSGVDIPIVTWVTNKILVMFPDRINMNETFIRDGIHDPTGWNYTPGDGRVNVSLNERNISYQYVNRGVWNASLEVSNSAGTNISYKLITVIGYAGFTPDESEQCHYSVSRALDIIEKMRVDCQLCGKCKV